MTEPNRPDPTPKHSDQTESETPGNGVNATGAQPNEIPPRLSSMKFFLSPPAQPDEIARLGPFRILKLLGEGGMGFVFLAEDSLLRRLVALKVMKPEVSATPQAKERFLREGRAAAHLKSDHITTIYQVGEVNGVPYLSMEYLDGMTLEAWLKKQSKRPSLKAILKVAHDLFRGLAAAHEKGLVHRDIKPSNLWIERYTNRIKVLDFGLTRGAKGEDQITQQGLVVGTPAYMAPEQANGQAVDARSDVFSAGVVLYRMVAGKSPFQRDSMMATLTSLAIDEPTPLVKVAPEVTGEFSDFVARLISKDPAKRPANATEVLTELAQLDQRIRNRPQSASSPYPPPIVEEANPWAGLGEDPTESVPEATEAVEDPLISNFDVTSSPLTDRSIVKNRSSNRVLIGSLLGAILVVIGGVILIQSLTPGDQIIDRSQDDPNLGVNKTKTASKTETNKKDPPKKAGTATFVNKIDFAAERKVAQKLQTLKKGKIYLANVRGEISGELHAKQNDLPASDFYITKADLRDCDLTDTELSLLSGCTRIGELLLANNPKLTDAGLIQLKLPSLWSLDLSSNSFTDLGMEFVQTTPRLEILNLSGTKITDRGILALQHTPYLRILSLNEIPTFTDEGISVLSKNCIELRQLQINGLTKASLKSLGALNQLRSLRCPGVLLTDEAIAILANLPQFESLEVSSPWIDGIFTRLKPLSEKLRSLQLQSSSDREEVSAISGWENLSAFRELEEFRINELRQSIDAQVLNSISLLPQIKKVVLRIPKKNRSYGPVDLLTLRNKLPSVHVIVDQVEFPPLSDWPGRESNQPITEWKLPKGAPSPAIFPFPPEDAKKHQDSWAKYIQQPVEVANSLGMKFRLIPPSEFDTRMAPDWGLDYLKRPLSRVRISQPYYLATTELTNEQFQKFVDETKYQTQAEKCKDGIDPNKSFVQTNPESHWKSPGKPITADRPVVYLAPADIQAFCEWLSKKEGVVYRVPSDIEWESAIRAGGDDILGFLTRPEEVLDYGWVKTNSPDKEIFLQPVAKRKPNPFGLYDLIGNGHEWCYSTREVGSDSQFQSVWNLDRCIGHAVNSDTLKTLFASGIIRKSGYGHVAVRILRQPMKDGGPIESQERGDPVKTLPEEPLGSYSLVAKPTPIPGIRSWSVEIKNQHGSICRWLPDGSAVTTLPQLTGCVGIWDTEGKLTKVLPGHPMELTALTVSLDGSLIASASTGDNFTESEIRIWNVKSGSCLSRYRFRLLRILSLAFSPDGNRLAFGGNNFQGWDWPGPLQIIDWKQNQIESLQSSQSWIDLAWFPDGKTMIGREGIKQEVLLIRSTEPKVMKSIPTKDPRLLSLSPDGKWIVIGHESDTLDFLDGSSHELRNQVTLPDKAIPSRMIWDRESHRLLVTSAAGTYLVSPNLKTAQIMKLTTAVWNADWSMDGREVRTIAPDGFRIIDSQTGEERKSRRIGFDLGVVHPAIGVRPQSSELFVSHRLGSSAYHLSRFNLQTGEYVGGWDDFSGTQLVFSPLGDQFASFSLDREDFNIHDANSGKKLRTLKMKSGSFDVVSWSPNGQKIATGGSSEDVTIWNLKNLDEKPQRLSDYRSDIYAISWAPQNDRLATITSDGIVRVWDTSTSKLESAVEELANDPGRLRSWRGMGSFVWAPGGGTLYVQKGSNVGAILDPGLSLIRRSLTPGIEYSTYTFPSPNRDRIAGGNSASLFLTEMDLFETSSVGKGIFRSQLFWHNDSRRLLGMETGPTRFVVYDTRKKTRLGTLVPVAVDGTPTGTHWLSVAANGHWRGSLGVESYLMYVVQHEDGTHRVYSAKEFTDRFGWKNDPTKVNLLKP